jgi:O-antigen/teichoic acid export membrane protein
MVGLISSAFSRIYLIVIGKFFSAESLGFYTRAQQFVTLPANSLTSIIDRIAFPIFSTIQNDDEKLLKGYRKTVVLGAFFNFPLMLGVAVISEPLIRLLLTDKWLPAVPYLQLMCIGSFLTPMQNLTLSLIKAKGDSRLFLKLDVLKKILTVGTLLVTYRWGIIAIIYGSIVLAYLAFYINFYFVGKKLNFSFGQQLIDIAPYALIALISAIAMYLAGHLTPKSDILTILIQTSIGVVVYLGISKLFKVEAFQESVHVLSGIRTKFQKNR